MGLEMTEKKSRKKERKRMENENPNKKTTLEASVSIMIFPHFKA